MAEIWLGLAGDLCSPEYPCDHYTTRVGGAPVFPGSAVPWGSSPPKCQVCGSPLSMVLQAYAPLPILPERVILLLGCTKAGCGKSSGCWQAFRCQLPSEHEIHHQQPQQQTDGTSTQPAATLQQTAIGSSGSPPASVQAPAAAAASAHGTGFDLGGDDWGFAGGTDGSIPGWDFPQVAAAGASSSSGGAFDFSDLTSSLAATVQQQQRHQEQEVHRKREQKQQQADAAAAAAAEEYDPEPDVQDVGSSRSAAGPQLPEFYLLAELEPDASGIKTIPNKELQHVQQLLAAYEATEGAPAAAATTNTATATTSSSSTQRSAVAAAAAAAGSADGAEGDGGVSWAGEEYEPDRVQCMQGSYLKFMKRLGRQPQQCARYSHSGPLLWPKAQAPQPRPCPSCGGPRVFEVQLMPALSQMVMEAAGMAQDQGLAVDADVVNAVANWDWCTVAVFTCQNSCGKNPGTGQCHAAAEEVMLVTEAECESQAGQAAGGGGAGGGADQQQGDDEDVSDG